MGSLQRVPAPPPAASRHDRPPIRRRSEPLHVRNRMREICTSGSVGGEDGNVLAYPAQKADTSMLTKRTERCAVARREPDGGHAAQHLSNIETGSRRLCTTALPALLVRC